LLRGRASDRGELAGGAADPSARPSGPAAAAAGADEPDTAAAADRLDRLRDSDRRPARDLGAELPGDRQGQDLQELHGEGLRRDGLLAADRQAAQPGAAGARAEGVAGRTAGLRA